MTMSDNSEKPKRRFSVISESKDCCRAILINHFPLLEISNFSKAENLRNFLSAFMDHPANLHQSEKYFVSSICNPETLETLSIDNSLLEKITCDFDCEELQKYFKNDHVMVQTSRSLKRNVIKCDNGDKTVIYKSDIKSDYYSDILKNANFVDVTFYLEGRTINAHKVILSRVPYFKRLFENESKEFHLKDIKYSIFKQVLRYIYTDEISLLDFKLACELYVVSNDFGFFNLQQICASYLGGNLTTKNCLLVLILCRDCKDRSLLEKCLKFIQASDVKILSEDAL